MLKIFFKSIFVLTLLLFCYENCSASQINFNNELYVLKYSAVSPHTQGYLNEYTRSKETISNWSKLIVVHYYPNKTYPTGLTNEMRTLINENKNAKLINTSYDKEKDISIISFVVSGSDNNKKYLEYTVFKYEKFIRNGVLALQYSQRYWLNSFSESPKIMEEIKTDDSSYMDLIKSTPMPKLVERRIGLS